MTGPTMTSPRVGGSGDDYGHGHGTTHTNTTAMITPSSATAVSATASVTSTSMKSHPLPLPANTKSDYLHYLTSYETMVRQQDSEYDATKNHILNNVYRRVQLLGSRGGKKQVVENNNEEIAGEGNMLTYLHMRRCLLRLGIGWKRSYFPTKKEKLDNEEDGGNEHCYDDDDVSVLSFNSTSSRHSGVSGGLFSTTGSSAGGGVGGGDIIVSDAQLIMLLVTLVEMEERHRARTTASKAMSGKHQQQKGLYLPDFILAYKLIIGGMQSIKSVNNTASEGGDDQSSSQAKLALCTRLKERTLGMLQPFGPNCKIYNEESTDDAFCHLQQPNRIDRSNRTGSDDAFLSSSSSKQGSSSLRDNIKGGQSILSDLQQQHPITKSTLSNKDVMKKVMRSKDVTLAKILEEHELEIENVSCQLEALRLEELQMRKSFQKRRIRIILFALLAGCVVLSTGILLEKRYRLHLEQELLLSQREKERRIADARTIELLQGKKIKLEKKLYVIEGKMRYQVDRTKDMDMKVAEITTQLNDVDMKWLIDKVEIDRCRSSQVELVEVLKNEQTKNENGSEELVWCRSRLHSQERELNELEHVSGSSARRTDASTWGGKKGEQNVIAKSDRGEVVDATAKHKPVYLEMKYNKSMRNIMLVRQTYSAVAGMAVSAILHGLMGAFMPKAATAVLAPVLKPSAAEVILGRAEKVVDGIFGSSVAFLLVRAVVAFVGAL